MASNSPIFHDPAGRRWRRVKQGGLALAIIATTLVAIFIASVLANPVLPTFKLRPVASLPHVSDLNLKAPNIPHNPGEQKARRSKAELQQALAKTKRVVPGKRRSQIPIASPPATFPAPVVPTSRPLSIGFYTNWDDSSYESLKRNLNNLDWVVPAWIQLQDDSQTTNPVKTDIDAPALNWIRETRPQVRILPMIQNLRNEKFDGQLLARAVTDDKHRQALIDSLSSFVQENQLLVFVLTSKRLHEMLRQTSFHLAPWIGRPVHLVDSRLDGWVARCSASN